MRNAAPALFASLALAACAAQPLPPVANLPPGAVVAGTDPLRAGVLESAHTFNSGTASRSAADAARAAAWVEYLAADSKWGGRWADFSPVARARLDDARGELRQALGISAEAPPQLVVNALFLAANTMQAGIPLPDLPPGAFADPNLVLQRLRALPPLPRTREATAMVERDLLRIDQERQFQGGPGGGNGGSRS